MKKIVVVILALILAGCAPRGFDRGVLRARLSDVPVEVTDEDIKQALELKPQLAFPIKLAVCFEPESGGNGRYSPEWRWEGEDKDAVLALAPELRDAGIVSDMFVITDAAIEGKGRKAIRLAAARHSADAVLVIKGVADVDEYMNPLALLYITIIGYWIVPGSNYDALFLSSAALWDVGNEYLYLTTETEGLGSATRPLLTFSGEETALGRAKKQAMEVFKVELVKRLKSLKSE